MHDLNKLDIRVQNGKSRKNRASKIFEIPKTKRKQENKNIETYILEDSDEVCLSEIKRETLTRQFTPSTFNIISLNSVKNNRKLISNPDS